MRLKKVLTVGFLVTQFVGINSASAASRPHDHISPLTNGANKTSDRFLPRLSVNGGCRPYTAVDKDGNYNAGLQDSGSENGKCTSKEKAQVYSRAKRVNANTHGIMYAYYFPKDNGYIVPSIGHRHDWEHVIVFVRNMNKSGETIVGAAYSAHGGVSTTRSPNKSGNQIYINYDYHGSVTHSFKEGSSGSNSGHKLITWSKLPAKPKNTLNKQSFGSAVVPLKDSNNRFNNLIEQARASIGISK